MKITIRELRPNEIDKYVPVRQQLWQGSASEFTDEMKAMFAQPERFRNFVAVNEAGEFVGWLEAALREIPDSVKPEKMGYIEGWFVVPQYRRKGIGKKLVQAAEAWACERGCSVMGSDTWPENEVSLIAHEKLGYKVYERAVNFRKKLHGG